MSYRDLREATPERANERQVANPNPSFSNLFEGHESREMFARPSGDFTISPDNHYVSISNYFQNPEDAQTSLNFHNVWDSHPISAQSALGGYGDSSSGQWVAPPGAPWGAPGMGGTGLDGGDAQILNQVLQNQAGNSLIDSQIVQALAQKGGALTPQDQGLLNQVLQNQAVQSQIDNQIVQQILAGQNGGGEVPWGGEVPGGINPYQGGGVGEGGCHHGGGGGGGIPGGDGGTGGGGIPGGDGGIGGGGGIPGGDGGAGGGNTGGGLDMSSIFSAGDSGVTQAEMQQAIQIADALPRDMQQALLQNGVHMTLQSGFQNGDAAGENTGADGQVFVDSGMFNQALVHELYEQAGQVSPNSLGGFWNDQTAVGLADQALSNGATRDPGDLNDTVGQFQGDGDLMSNAFVADFFARNPQLYHDTAGGNVISATVQDAPELIAYIAQQQALANAANDANPPWA